MKERIARWDSILAKLDPMSEQITCRKDVSNDDPYGAAPSVWKIELNADEEIGLTLEIRFGSSRTFDVYDDCARGLNFRMTPKVAEVCHRFEIITASELSAVYAETM